MAKITEASMYCEPLDNVILKNARLQNSRLTSPSFHSLDKNEGNFQVSENCLLGVKLTSCEKMLTVK